MAENTNIEWADDTFNPWHGCAEVSEGCDNCYAREWSRRNPSVLGVWGPQGTRVVASEAKWREPRRWNNEAGGRGKRRRVFCASIADVFEGWGGVMTDAQGRQLWRHRPGSPLGETSWGNAPWGPAGETFAEAAGYEALRMDHVRNRLLTLALVTRNLDWLFLTKRPENILPALGREVVRSAGPVATTFHDLIDDKPIPNFWFGTTVENQARAAERIPELLKVPAAVRFLSCEPLLGPLDLSAWLKAGGLHWVIVGGESGPKARPFDVTWAEELVNQCAGFGVPCFVKQLGSKPVDGNLQTPKLKSKKGGDWDDLPFTLRVRQFPGDLPVTPWAAP